MVNFNFTYSPGVTLQQMMGFELAGRIWSQHLRDSITVNIHVGMSNDLPAGVIGGALPGITPRQQFSQFYQRYSADVKSADDQTAFANLPVQGTRLSTLGTTLNTSTGSSSLLISSSISGTNTSSRTFSMRTSTNFSAASTQTTPTAFQGLFDVNQVNSAGWTNTTQVTKTSEVLNLSRANAKALGMLDGQSQGLDGYILMSHLNNQPFTWNYDYARSQVPASNSLDFLSTALHEVGHVLGFISGIDRPGWLNSTVYSATEREAYINSLDQHIRSAMPLDFFRLSPSDMWMNMTFGGTRIFSLDRGGSSIAQFATGKDAQLGGDGFQASHWTAQNGTTGIMNPALAPGQRVNVSQVDLRALDVIGYDRATTQPLSQSTLLTEVQQAIAQRSGQSVAWVTANASTSPQQLTQDRSQDIQTMVQGSEIYEWGTTGSGTTSNSGRRWMEVFFQQRIQIPASTTSTEPVTDSSNGSAPTSTGSGAASRRELRAIANSVRDTNTHSTSKSTNDALHNVPVNVWASLADLPDSLIRHLDSNQRQDVGNVEWFISAGEGWKLTGSLNSATSQSSTVTLPANSALSAQTQTATAVRSINFPEILQSPTLFTRLGAGENLLVSDALGGGLLTTNTLA